MDFTSFVQGPLLRCVFAFFFLGVAIRLGAFLIALIRTFRKRHSGRDSLQGAIARVPVPLSRVFRTRGFYALSRYGFHLLLLSVPVFLTGHISLLEESQFQLSWPSVPDELADYSTIAVLVFLGFFLCRRIGSKERRAESKISDYVLLVLTALPFVTGYFLAHNTLGHMTLLGVDMWTLHILSGQAMLCGIVFLFCRTRLNAKKCTGCAACELSCPTGSLESSDKENIRIISYSHCRCVWCGECMSVCPDEAAGLAHQFGAKPLYRAFSKDTVRRVEHAACGHCGSFFAPMPQVQKASDSIQDEYVFLCPECRAMETANRVHKLAF